MKNEKTDYIKLRTYIENDLWIVKVEKTNYLVNENAELESNGVAFTPDCRLSAGFLTRSDARVAIRKCKDHFPDVHITGGLH